MALTRPWIGFVLDGVQSWVEESKIPASCVFQNGFGLGVIHPFPDVSPSPGQPKLSALKCLNRGPNVSCQVVQPIRRILGGGRSPAIGSDVAASMERTTDSERAGLFPELPRPGTVQSSDFLSIRSNLSLRLRALYFKAPETGNIGWVAPLRGAFLDDLSSLLHQ